MFAVIKAGGKQYRVAAEDVIRIDRVEKKPGEVVSFGEVLVVGGDTPSIGAPTVSGATVAGEVIAHERGDKVIAFKKRRRKNSRRKRGHRQEFTLIGVTEILTDGASPTKTAFPRPEPKPKAAEASMAEAADSDADDDAPEAKAKSGKKPGARKPTARGKAKSKK